MTNAIPLTLRIAERFTELPQAFIVVYTFETPDKDGVLIVRLGVN